MHLNISIASTLWIVKIPFYTLKNVCQMTLLSASPVLIISFIAWESFVASESSAINKKMTLFYNQWTWQRARWILFVVIFMNPLKGGRAWKTEKIVHWRRGRQKAKSPSWLLSVSSTRTQSVWQKHSVIWYECHQPHTFL